MIDRPYPGMGHDQTFTDQRIRFSLQLQYRGETTHHNLDLDPRGAGLAEAVGYRFEPDDVRAFLNGDYTVLMVAGVDPSAMQRDRGLRREAFEDIGGKLALHALDEIEAAEGWFAP